MPLEGFQEYNGDDAERYNRKRWWPGLSWGDVFDKATDLYPHKVGLVDDAAGFTYRELREKVDRLAVSLIELGIRQGDFALIQLPNWHEFIISYFALQKIGVRVIFLWRAMARRRSTTFVKPDEADGWIVPEKYGTIDYGHLIAESCKEQPSD